VRRVRCMSDLAGMVPCSGLGLYLAGEVSGGPVATANSPEVQNFNVKSIQEWTAVVEASGTADADAIAAAEQASLA
jgi:hypothetical protein